MAGAPGSGRRAEPTALKLLRGSKTNSDEPVAPKGHPVCPPEASAQVKAIWNYTLEQLDAMRVTSLADRDMLFAYCVAVAAHRKATAQLESEGFVIRGLHGGMVKHPAGIVQRDAAHAMRQYGQLFGLTPSGRSSIKVGGVQREDVAARLLSS